MTKFDMGRAFDDAMAMLRANKELVLVVAGVFFFLPQLLFTLATAEDIAAFEAAAAKAPSPEVMFEQISNIYLDNWWIMVALILAAAIGSIGLTALLADKSRPTLGDALKTGLRFLPTYIGMQILVGLIAAVIVIIPSILAGATGSIAIAVIGFLIVIPIIIYMSIRLGLGVPVIAIEELANPIKVLQRSWLLTKDNGMRLLGFSLLLGIAWIVVAIVVSLVFGLIFGLMGEQASLIGNGIVSCAVQAGFTALIAAVLVAAYHQLSVSGTANLEETFE